MLKIEVNIHLNSYSDIAPVHAKIQEVLTQFSALHEPMEPTEIASVKISEVVTTLTPVLEGSFFTDTLSIR